MAGYDKTKLQLWKVRRERRLCGTELTASAKKAKHQRQEEAWASAMKGQNFGQAGR